jgi:hypothetical protein
MFALIVMNIGLSIEFGSKKFYRIYSERFPLFRGRKCSFRGIPRFTKESIPKLGTLRNYMKKISFSKNPAPANRIESVVLSGKCFGTEFLESLLLFLFLCTEFRAFFSSAERFGTEFREFSVPRNSRNSTGTK